MLAEADNSGVRELATRISERKLFKCLDVREQIMAKLGHKAVSIEARKRTNAKIEVVAEAVEQRLRDWGKQPICQGY